MAVVGVLKKVDDAQYSWYIKRKLVEWYKLTRKSDRPDPSQEERGKEVNEDGEEGQGGCADVGDEEGLHLIQIGLHLNRPGAAFEPG